MLKKDELSNPNSCINKAMDLEMVFVLKATDPAAPVAIIRWAIERVSLGKNKITDPKIIEALQCAQTMQEQCKAIDEERRKLGLKEEPDARQ